MISDKQLEEWREEYSALKRENAVLKAEIAEQCRLNGMGAERELKLITQNKDLKSALNTMQQSTKECKHWAVEATSLQIGKYFLSKYVHGGLWLCKKDGEGGQVKDENLSALETLIEQFWELWF